eukprot:CAMPEP_0173472850 /NCGR_PEP_ID=MMETSP1357-20121228/79108_1 /TAXON_ID=77926 /ORGANISM="Hemiselmis rufescens, Strain PCC563" /LENGTH=55 /DNA_ID=CAMNT_0014441175 /DNA_START=522 /DNA_END=686 /DNA_ORIENTATION=+
MTTALFSTQMKAQKAKESAYSSRAAGRREFATTADAAILTTTERKKHNRSCLQDH